MSGELGRTTAASGKVNVTDPHIKASDGPLVSLPGLPGPARESDADMRCGMRHAACDMRHAG